MAKSASARGGAHRVEDMGALNPAIAAEAFEDPLVIRLAKNADEYGGGRMALSVDRRDVRGRSDSGNDEFEWGDHKESAEKCGRTFQAHVVTEKAAIGVACLLVPADTGLAITQVTRLGEKADYWLGDMDALVEVSGTQGDALNRLYARKREQLLDNPYGKAGYVVVVDFEGKKKCIFSHEKRRKRGGS